jgi:hypothetical protein
MVRAVGCACQAARKGSSMEKWLCWGSLGVAGLLLLIFLVDLILGVPLFMGEFGDRFLVDLLGILACGLVGYLAWESFREIR